MATIVGGAYFEQCMCPMWQELFGSGGRAATAIARLGGKAKLATYVDETAEAILRQRAALEGFTVEATTIEQSLHFRYTHGLANPSIRPAPKPAPSLKVMDANVIRFGMLEGDSVVTAYCAVYDPQNPTNPVPFHANGSKAQRLALVLNRSEAEALHGSADLNAASLARALAKSQSAEIVIIKMGPAGALLYYQDQIHHIPSYITSRVWKVGSGDVFVATFARFWADLAHDPVDAAEKASRATAYYCQTQGFVQILPRCPRNQELVEHLWFT